MVEDDAEGDEQTCLEVDLFVGRDDGYGQGAEREEAERDQGGKEHGPRELRLRPFQFGGVHGVDLDTGEEQQDAGQEGDVAHARDVGEQARVHVVRGVGPDYLGDRGGDVLEGDSVAPGQPDDGHQDDDDAGQDRADEKPAAREVGERRGAAEGDPGCEPVHGDREAPYEDPVLGQCRETGHVGGRGGGESQHGGVPDDVLDPLQEDGREAQVGVEGLLDPGVDTASAGGEGAAQFGAHECRGNQKEERGEEDVEKHGELLLRHHRKSAQADDRRGGHQSELRG